MHNCKETKERFSELVLDGIDSLSDPSVSAELSRCAECRDEFEALSATLRTANRLGEMATPAEDYWPGYHSRLRQKMVNRQSVTTTSRAQAQRRREKLGPLFEPLRPGAGTSLFVKLLRTSVPVPVPLPLGIAIVVAAALLIPFAIRAARRDVTPSNNTTIVRVPVEVPVIQENVVTRVIYRERRSVAKASKRTTEAARAESTFAKSQKSQTEAIPVGLSGFKPSEEIKLTVIKGGVPNEK